ncbi:DUF1566 domain-containing protein [Microbulbifer halophilus]|uniref:DUF1566 domain-containing protein n=1 Tax=Microbulbifer halophilus TaxID=453963 RepID=A0ABW5E923_9GAMM|nr:DUF1566 domain-containing protein [Microbulbifer halophilus]MCW8125084.1 DUF1566 domain-containing protein [Microbulbifer halophilus]
MSILLTAACHAQADQLCKTGHIATTAPPSRYQQKEDSTVVDTKTGLMWRTCQEGVAGKSCGEGAPLMLTWAEALAYVPTFNREGGFAGYRDWRLPNIRELSSLIEPQCVAPAINLTVFPNTAPVDVWSSSPSRFHSHYSWLVDFETGAFTYGERARPKAIHLVRDRLVR